MKKIILTLIFIFLFSLTGCNFCCFFTNDSMCKVIKETFKEKEILDFIDSLIKNNKYYYSLIKSSKYYDTNYSIIFDDKILTFFFEDCNKNGNYIDKKYMFDKTELYKIENRFDRPRYPLDNREEYKEVLKIANIYVSDNKSDQKMIFTFCLKINGIWYLRGIGTDTVIL